MTCLMCGVNGVHCRIRRKPILKTQFIERECLKIVSKYLFIGIPVVQIVGRSRAAIEYILRPQMHAIYPC